MKPEPSIRREQLGAVPSTLTTDRSEFRTTSELASALSGDGHSLFALAMSKGGKILVPADKIAYVEFGAPEARRVGFGNIV